MPTAQRIKLFPTAHQTQRTSLDGTEFQLRFDYFERLRGWYLTIEDADGNELTKGRRLRNFIDATLGVKELDGILLAVAPDYVDSEDNVDEIEVYYLHD